MFAFSFARTPNCVDTLRWTQGSVTRFLPFSPVPTRATRSSGSTSTSSGSLYPTHPNNTSSNIEFTSLPRIRIDTRWYRVMSPTIALDIRSVTYNSSRHELFLDITQQFHIRWSPLTPTPARLLTRLTLSPSVDDPKLFVISMQEDFYHPEELTALVMPPLAPLTQLMLRAGSLTSNVNAYVFSLFGEWLLALVFSFF